MWWFQLIGATSQPTYWCSRPIHVLSWDITGAGGQARSVCWHQVTCSPECSMVWWSVSSNENENPQARDKSENSYQVWRQLSTFMRHYFQQRYTDYWRSSISDNMIMNDPKALWSKISALLDHALQAPSSATAHTADVFTNHFRMILASEVWSKHALLWWQSNELTFKVIQGHQLVLQSKAHIWLPISD